jgi:hypothetical protein
LDIYFNHKNIKLMKSKDYLNLLLNEYENKELSKEDLESTLKHYAELFSKEKSQKTKMIQDFKSKKDELPINSLLNNSNVNCLLPSLMNIYIYERKPYEIPRFCRMDAKL